jgi:hypothetical protein
MSKGIIIAVIVESKGEKGGIGTISRWIAGVIAMNGVEKRKIVLSLEISQKSCRESLF